MRDRHEDFTAKGADVVAIGMGSPEMASHFRSQQDVPFRLLVDPDRTSYRILQLGRGSLMQIMGPQVWIRAAKGLLRGAGLARARQDPFQLGGAAVVEKGEITFLHRAETSADNPSIDDLLEALS